MNLTEQSFNSTLRQVSPKKLAQNGGKIAPQKRKALKSRSLKRAAQEREYFGLVAKLKAGCQCADYKFRSELPPYPELAITYDGQYGAQVMADAHHIEHRENARLLNVFAIIIVTRAQHESLTNGALAKAWTPGMLKDLIRAKRIQQGFDPAQYGESLPQ